MPSLCVIVVCRGFLLCLNWNVAAVYRSTTMRKTSFFKLIDEVRELPTGTLMYFGNNTLYSTTHISPYQSYWCLRNQRVTATLIFIGILSSITVSLFSISFSSSWQMNSNVDLDILKLVIQSWSINVPLTILSHYSVLLSLSHSILDGVRSWLTKLHRVNAKKNNLCWVCRRRNAYLRFSAFLLSQPSKSFSFPWIFGTSAKLSSHPSDTSVNLSYSL